MSSFHVRPRFSQVVDGDPEVVAARIESGVKGESGRFELQCFPGFVIVRIAEKDRHFWSPRLNLSLEATGQGKSRIEGKYGPNANVWALFFFGYLMVGVLGMIAAVLALSQWMLDLHPWGFWVLGGALAGLVTLYLVAQTGRKLGARQTFQLHQAYESVIGQPAEIR